MKKILIVALAAGIGLVANAATVKWQVTNVQNSPDVAVAAGWAVQIYTSTVAYDYDKAVAGDISATFSGVTSQSGTSFRATGTETNGQANDTTVSYYMVIYDNASIADANNYIVSSVKSLTTNAAGSDATLSFGNMAGTTTANMFLGSTWTASAPIPEPTSGLLLVLGMAGLALRRRRA